MARVRLRTAPTKDEGAEAGSEAEAGSMVMDLFDAYEDRRYSSVGTAVPLPITPAEGALLAQHDLGLGDDDHDHHDDDDDDDDDGEGSGDGGERGGAGKATRQSHGQRIGGAPHQPSSHSRQGVRDGDGQRSEFGEWGRMTYRKFLEEYWLHIMDPLHRLLYDVSSIAEVRAAAAAAVDNEAVGKVRLSLLLTRPASTVTVTAATAIDCIESSLLASLMLPCLLFHSHRDSHLFLPLVAEFKAQTLDAPPLLR